MTVSEKLQEVSLYAKNSMILLFREGMFWKAYQEAAYLFVANLRRYQVNRNYVKKVGMDVLSLGFPVPSAAKILSGVDFREEGERIFVVLPDITFLEEDYQQWREGVNAQPAVSRKPSGETLLAYKHAYDILIQFYQINRNVEREYKFSLCEKIKEELHETLMKISIAAEKDNVGERVAFVDGAMNVLNSVKIRIRLLHDLRQLPLKHYAALAEKIAGLLNELGRWRKVMVH